MNDEKENKNIVISNNNVPSKINLSPTAEMDISFLTEDERKVLLKGHIEGMLNISRKAQELHVDSASLKKTLEDLSDATKDVTEGNNAVTITHTQTTNIGRTEIMMGNTEKAYSGKFSKSQTGEKDWTPYYVFGGVIVLIIMMLMIGK